MRSTIRTFKNVRARIQRAADGAWHAGWVVHLSAEMARVRLQGFISLNPGERFTCEFYGDGTLVRFQGLVAGQQGQEVALAVSGAMAFEPSRESVRVLVENVSGTIRDELREANLIVLDASPDSMGGMADSAFAPSATLEVRLEIGDRTYQGTARVANCRPEESQAGYYRIGLIILDAPRLSTAVWRRMVEEHTER